MCLNPKTIYTKSKFVDVSSLGSSLSITVNCGKCPECRDAKIKEYFTRIKAQTKACQEAGGFVFWDSLTYSQENVPCFSIGRGLERSNINFSDGYSILTFNADDYRNYFKRLRQNLKRAGFDNKLCYYFVCEYGGITHRPHYHVVYFIYDKHITPRIFDDLVRKSWKLGINDMFRKDGSLKNPIEKVINGDGAIMYVAKYVVKDDEYLKILEEFSKQHNIDSDTYKSLLPFHRQSQGFGIDLIKQENFIYDTGSVIIDTSSGKKEITAPNYIIRKLYFKNVKRVDGSYCWIPTEKGLDYLTNIYSRKIDLGVKRIDDAIELGKKYDFPDLSFHPSDRFKEFMNNRSSRDLSIYQLFYRGRILNVGYSSDDPPTVRQLIQSMYDFKQKDFSKPRNKRYYKSAYIFHKDDDSKHYTSIDGNSHYSVSSFVDKYSIDSSSYNQFYGFDECLDMVYLITYVSSLRNCDEITRINAIKNRIKKLKSRYGW